MKYLVVAIMVSLGWLHHDWWWGDLEGLALFGIPASLAYRVEFSLATAAAWVLAVYQAWPKELERWTDADDRRARHHFPLDHAARQGNAAQVFPLWQSTVEQR